MRKEKNKTYQHKRKGSIVKSETEIKVEEVFILQTNLETQIYHKFNYIYNIHINFNNLYDICNGHR